MEIVAAEYTDAPMNTGSGPKHTSDGDSSASVDLGATPYPGPLGPTGPAGSALMSLADAVEAQAAMNQRAAARIRDMRRR